MKRFEFKKHRTQIVIIPTFGLMKRTVGAYNYKYRIAFAWLIFGASIGFVKAGKHKKYEIPDWWPLPSTEKGVNDERIC